MTTPYTDLHLPFKISVCGRGELPCFKGCGITHLLSIDSPGSPTATPEWFTGVHWHVAFVDVETKAMAAAFGLAPPGKNDVKLILEFGKMCLESSRTAETHLVIHCLAGISRSPAAAYAILCLLLGPGCEQAAFAHLMEIRPCASPNRLVVKYADAILGRNRKMIEAQNAFG